MSNENPFAMPPDDEFEVPGVDQEPFDEAFAGIAYGLGLDRLLKAAEPDFQSFETWRKR